MAAEKIYENKIKRYLESVGVYRLGTSPTSMTAEPVGYYEKRHGSVFTSKGLPDLHICIHGKSIEVEVKAENGRPSEMQLFMIRQINTAGGCAIVTYPSDFNELKRLIGNFL